jgi:hypothetical protein
MKLQEIPVSENNQKGNYLHYCQGCDGLHMINTVVKNQNNAIWSFNNNFDLPTFSPSININLHNNKRCHYFIINGKINYCSDCTHSLKGQELQLLEIPENFL